MKIIPENYEKKRGDGHHGMKFQVVVKTQAKKDEAKFICDKHRFQLKPPTTMEIIPSQERAVLNEPLSIKVSSSGLVPDKKHTIFQFTKKQLTIKIMKI